MPRRDVKSHSELFPDPADEQNSKSRVLLPIGKRALLDVFCGGVLPAHLTRAGCVVERPRLPHGQRFLADDAQRWFFAEVGAEEWSTGVHRDGLPATEILTIYLPDDRSKRDLLGRIRAVEGMPHTLPRLEVAAERFSVDGVPFEGFEELDPRAAHDLPLGRVAAASLVLFAGIRDVQSRKVLDAALSPMSDLGVSQGGIVASFSRVAECSESVARCLFDWVAARVTDQEDPMARLGLLVAQLSLTREIDQKLLDALRDHVQSILQGTRAVDEGRLRDEGRIDLRAIAGLFRCSRVDGPTVDAFLQHQSIGTVGVRVGLAMRLLATWAEGGFASMVGVWKSDEDLYRIGSFLAAGQTDRVCVERNSSSGWQVVSDGMPVKSLSMPVSPPSIEPVDRDSASPVLTRLAGLLGECGYSVVAGVSPSAFDLLGEPLLRVVIAADSRTVAFVASITLGKRGKKSHQPQFVMALLQEQLRCQVLLGGFPFVEVSRDQLLRDINHDELTDHVSAVRAAAARVEQIWNEQAATPKRPKASSEDDRPDTNGGAAV